jgi:hypothetical protein
MPFDIVLSNFDQIADALSRFPDIAAVEFEKASSASLLSLIPFLADYPPAEPTWRRTGTLGRLWTSARPEFSAFDAGFEGSISNAAPHGPFVQGAPEDEPHQAWMHNDRWKTTDQIVNSQQPNIDAYFEQALQNIADTIDRGG